VPKHIKLNREQQEVLDAMHNGASIFLTGNAGTGKSSAGLDGLWLTKAIILRNLIVDPGSPCFLDMNPEHYQRKSNGHD
jgi:hypothetical protein